MKRILVALSLLSCGSAGAQNADAPFRIAIAGLTHGHVDGFLHAARNRPNFQIVGLYDPDVSLQTHYGEKYGIAKELFFSDVSEMLTRVRPEAVAIFTSTAEHPALVEAVAANHVPVMMEKPLAVDTAGAKRIERASRKNNVPVIVNYETTWYPSHAEMRRLLEGQGAIRKMVAMDGHQGPKEINVGPEFLQWLTDPVRNGAGALFDFGCYGANLMTWMMNNRKPLAVTAILQTEKPSIYPKVDDEATVLLQYAGAQGIIQASWNWPFSRKDFETYTETASAVATGGDNLRFRLKNDASQRSVTLPPLLSDEADSLSYLRSVARKKRQPDGLSSLENNMIVVEVLEAARESARTGRKVEIH